MANMPKKAELKSPIAAWGSQTKGKIEIPGWTR
jgi:hypothetical protein